MPNNLACRVVQSPWFDSICAVILVTNAIFIGVQAEVANDEGVSPLSLLVVDCAYTVMFTTEVLFRLCAVGCRVFFCHPADMYWNIFDVVVVGISGFENLVSIFFSGGATGMMASVSALRIVRIARLVRILRVCRLMRFFRSLRILTAAILNTVKN